MSQRRKRIVALLLLAIATPTLCLQSHRRPCHQQSWTRTSVTSLKAWSLPSPPTHTFRSLDWYQEIKNPCRAPNTPVRKDYEDDDEDSYYLSQEMLLEWKHEAEREQPRVARWSRVARFTRRVFTLFSWTAYHLCNQVSNRSKISSPTMKLKLWTWRVYPDPCFIISPEKN